MYPLVSRLSFLIRFLLCGFTIEQYPIFANETIQWVVGQILSIYTILWVICYFITGKVASKFGIQSQTGKSVLYFFIYLPLVFLTYGILWGLTKFGVLPF